MRKGIISIGSTGTLSEALTPCPVFVPSSFSLSSLVPWLFELKLHRGLCREQKGMPCACAVNVQTSISPCAAIRSAGVQEDAKTKSAYASDLHQICLCPQTR
ncbi:uncharacterized protein LOC135374262 [Ornithodoros turicata]|uniref:uncharacterized protein LOC135374262 n=1 Tax=Ornithodoros turicata TaxID=34597 RepID=UPI0031399F17